MMASSAFHATAPGMTDIGDAYHTLIPVLGPAAGALFLVSITCRAIDQAICPAWPIGSHVGWHLVNAAMLYSCMRGLLADSAAPSAPAKHTVKSIL